MENIMINSHASVICQKIRRYGQNWNEGEELDTNQSFCRLSISYEIIMHRFSILRHFYIARDISAS
jgi:hypothetical protein